MRQHKRQQRERDRERQTQQDGYRVDEAFKLCGQHHVHKHDGQDKRDDVALGGAPELLTLPHQSGAVLGGHVEAGDGFVQHRQYLTERLAAHQVRRQQNLPLAIVALNLGRPVGQFQRRHAGH